MAATIYLSKTKKQTRKEKRVERKAKREEKKAAKKEKRKKTTLGKIILYGPVIETSKYSEDHFVNPITKEAEPGRIWFFEEGFVEVAEKQEEDEHKWDAYWRDVEKTQKEMESQLKDEQMENMSAFDRFWYGDFFSEGLIPAFQIVRTIT